MNVYTVSFFFQLQSRTMQKMNGTRGEHVIQIKETQVVITCGW